MVDLDVLDRINALLAAEETTTTNTSMRLPSNLRRAADIAAKELGLASSTTVLTADALRETLREAVNQAALDAHYARYPDARPTLAELALALAEQLGSPLAAQPQLLAAVAEQIVEHHPRAEPDHVLLWAEAQSVPPAVGAAA